MLGNVLRYIRVCNDLTVKEVGEKIGLTNNYVCAIESARKGTSLRMLQKFSECYDMEISKILYFNELDEQGKDRKEILKEILEYYIEKDKTENKNKIITK